MKTASGGWRESRTACETIILGQTASPLCTPAFQVALAVWQPWCNTRTIFDLCPRKISNDQLNRISLRDLNPGEAPTFGLIPLALILDAWAVVLSGRGPGIACCVLGRSGQRVPRSGSARPFCIAPGLREIEKNARPTSWISRRCGSILAYPTRRGLTDHPPYPLHKNPSTPKRGSIGAEGVRGSHRYRYILRLKHSNTNCWMHAWRADTGKWLASVSALSQRPAAAGRFHLQLHT
ncbi:hypothetical protein P152DRAFT_282954 [Eremomyces bilateralis CBS 781.70]|uniref:Uncharacterized protein n=1 Tax=Eremomyces bilateralis CBS 781.70 TaxID=1392243 RepID=A0A6G1G9Y4_9PEZI|nr:uncharacterized protein P152DRAFT_282954 [Eremomyces bilateralis CBS 781.70]KAF1814669.1 hypothetical protein P152DRAFT_282954 [Eremomyces bilateralis CBS 781.70]